MQCPSREGIWYQLLDLERQSELWVKSLRERLEARSDESGREGWSAESSQRELGLQKVTPEDFCAKGSAEQITAVGGSCRQWSWEDCVSKSRGKSRKKRSG